MADIILQKFFEAERWSTAIDKAVLKGVEKKKLRDLCTTEKRISMLADIVNGRYEIAPPHQAEIPKDDGTMRIVYVNEGIDRVFLSIANDLLMEICSDMIHQQCKSYQSGIGCGKVVKEVSRNICNTREIDGYVGYKSDLSKYFDSVPIEFIDLCFDKVEERYDHSVIIDVLRKYYHADWCFDVDGNLINHYQSLKQGCAVASFLADALLYHIDEQLTKLNGYYVRYSDDILFIGTDYNKAMDIMRTELNKMGLTLNPKKVQYITENEWFKFLGYSIKGSMISISKKRLKNFQKEIMNRTVKCKGITYRKALNKVMWYLYKGEYSWASQMLGIINSERDIELLNEFVMDCLKCVKRGRTKVGGLGYEQHKDGVVTRGIGKNVNGNKSISEIDGYYSITCMRNNLLNHKELYDAIVSSIGAGKIKNKLNLQSEELTQKECIAKIEELYYQYRYSLPSERSERRHTHFKAVTVDDLTIEQMMFGMPREEALDNLESFIVANFNPDWIKGDDWYWYSNRFENLIISKEWIV